jgi:hypothetical protein
VIDSTTLIPDYGPKSLGSIEGFFGKGLENKQNDVYPFMSDKKLTTCLTASTAKNFLQPSPTADHPN